MQKNIITIGLHIPGNQAKNTPLKSKISLLDYDISIFDPNLDDFGTYEYKGKPALNDSKSVQFKEHIDHWRREIFEAIKAGKTVFLLLNNFEEVYVATGQYSDKALNTNYMIIPGRINVVNSHGTSMKLNTRENILNTYWTELGAHSEYRVFVNGEGVNPLVMTRAGEKIVGACIKYTGEPGLLVLLPYIDFNKDEFFKETNDEQYWTAEALKLGKQFISAIVATDKVVRETGEFTPEPEWVGQDKYTLPKEQMIRAKLLALESKIECLHETKEKLEKNLAQEMILKKLLYEKGEPLELAILEALKLIGFSVAKYKSGDSEFDVVFESKEGRIIGEAEGKDTKPINVDKLRQLEMNIHEDFAREDIAEMAKGALIGNAYRFLSPEERGDFFTEKCLIAANRSKTALIKATDLFYITKYLSKKKDEDFAKKCRQAILITNGVVQFPPIPQNTLPLAGSGL